MTAIRAVLFDLGKTLVDYGADAEWELLDPVSRSIWDSLLSRGYDLPPFPRFKRKIAWAMAWGRVLAKLRRRETNAERLAVKVARQMNPTISDEDLREAARAGFAGQMVRSATAPGAVEALRFCREAGYAMGLVSNTVLPGWILGEDLERRGLAAYFDFMVFSSEHGRPKPSMSIFAEAVSRTAVKPGETVFVGDNLRADIRGAKGAGMRTVWVCADEGDHRRGAPFCDAVVESLAQVPETLRAMEAAQ
ncbi:MAG: HAD family hydrolase [Planctomycetota bacterium]